ncbi:hypothetical protein B7492_11075 [Bacillus mycoides]|uniref:Uncharacterized protein n=1 Tax=Bacillus mycoides TaxID=1405 RepID=A0A1W6A7L8_BACMY|nr:hypothetical protein [Bacillus mycoides]ARJ20505.1 hypothetical protein B7492_04335 [Bacillus mycoides]ARJ21762.1 hypothetical protein B7492_11075 [Bacillus mycoides]
MLTLTIISFIAIVLGFLISRKVGFWSDWDIVGGIVMFVGGITFLICLLIIGVGRYESSVFIEKQVVLKETLKYNRDNLSELERLEMNKKVAEYNEQLTAYKYDNKHFFDICVVDEVSSLELLK